MLPDSIHFNVKSRIAIPAATRGYLKGFIFKIQTYAQEVTINEESISNNTEFISSGKFCSFVKMNGLPAVRPLILVGTVRVSINGCSDTFPISGREYILDDSYQL